MRNLIFTLFFVCLPSITFSQVLIGTNSKFNYLTFGLDANGVGKYIMFSYNRLQNGEIYRILKGPEENVAKDTINTSSTERNFKGSFGFIINNDNDIRFGIDIGLHYTYNEEFINYEIKGEKISQLKSGIPRCYPIAGFYANYKFIWSRVEINLGDLDSPSFNFGVFIPVLKSKSCKSGYNYF